MNKRIITIALAFMLPVLGVLAQAYKGRAPTAAEQRRLAGVSEYVQDVFFRDHVPVYLGTNAASPYSITNLYDGTFFIAPTNAELAAKWMSLPNPTNNIGRVFRFIPTGNCQFLLSNSFNGITAINSNTLATTLGVLYLCPSNQISVVYSTGTNYAVISH